VGSLAVLLSACGGGNSADDSTPTGAWSPQDSTATSVGATTATQAAVGERWAEIDGWETTGATTFYAGSAGERLLGVAVDDTPQAASPVRIFEQTDGRWIEAADLVEMGLPLVAGNPPPGVLAGEIAIGGDASVAVVAILIRPLPGVSADGALVDLWLAIDDGSGWTLAGPAETGIDQRVQGAKAFRFSSVAGVAAANGNVHVVFEGQWWEPYRTGGADFAVATRRSDGSWTTFAATEQDTGAGRMEPSSVTVSPGGALMAAGRGSLGQDSGIRLWGSAAGASWQPGPVLTDADGAFVTVTALAATDAGFLLAVTADLTGASRYTVLWHSADGITWQPAELPPLAEGERLAALAAVGEQFVAIDSEGSLWTSPDGTSWEALSGPTGSGARGGVLVALGDRLALVGPTAGHITPG